jgi:hypothetical protein
MSKAATIALLLALLGLVRPSVGLDPAQALDRGFSGPVVSSGRCTTVPGLRVVCGSSRRIGTTTVVPTHLSLRIHIRGSHVRFHGSLGADLKKCRAHQQIGLFRNKHLVASTTTTARGRYWFRRRVGHRSRWNTVHPKSSFGIYPDRFVCEASRSKRITL